MIFVFYFINIIIIISIFLKMEKTTRNYLLKVNFQNMDEFYNIIGFFAIVALGTTLYYDVKGFILEPGYVRNEQLNMAFVYKFVVVGTMVGLLSLILRTLDRIFINWNYKSYFYNVITKNNEKEKE